MMARAAEISVSSVQRIWRTYVLSRIGFDSSSSRTIRSSSTSCATWLAIASLSNTTPNQSPSDGPPTPTKIIRAVRRWHQVLDSVHQVIFEGDLLCSKLKISGVQIAPLLSAGHIRRFCNRRLSAARSLAAALRLLAKRANLFAKAKQLLVKLGKVRLRRRARFHGCLLARRFFSVRFHIRTL